jgi:hypothetical protein
LLSTVALVLTLFQPKTAGSSDDVATASSNGRYVTFQMAEVAVSRQMFADILSLIARLRAPPAPT